MNKTEAGVLRLSTTGLHTSQMQDTHLFSINTHNRFYMSIQLVMLWPAIFFSKHMSVPEHICKAVIKKENPLSRNPYPLCLSVL